MNIVNKVTWQHMKQNRKKTLVTLIGIILSVALITAISTFAESFLDMLRRDEIQTNGEWHVLFTGFPTDRLDELKSDENVKGALVSASEGCAWLEESVNEEKPYLNVRAYDELAMQEYPLTLLEGRMPENSEEIALPEHLKTNGGVNWKVGDTITLDFGQRYLVWEDGGKTESAPLPAEDIYHNPKDEDAREELRDAVSRTYRVVGIVARPNFERIYSASYSAFTFLDEAVLAENDKVNAAVQMRKLNESLYSWSEQIGTKTGADVSYHSSLLSFYLLSGRGGVTEMLNGLQWLLIAIVMLGSVAVIYSSFAISVSERSKYLGMMASVGATKRQKSQSVFFEGFLLGAAGIPLGLALGLLGTLVTMQFINPLLTSAFQAASGSTDGMQMRLIVSVPALFGAAAAAVVTIGVSAWIPARKASRITPIDAIRQTQDVKLTKKQVKVSPLTKKIFGFPGELALKNLKRNRKRYRATVLSLILCISLFLSVSAFSIYLSDAYVYSIGAEEDIPDIVINMRDGKGSESREELLELEGITRFAEYRDASLSIKLPWESFSEAARKELESQQLPETERAKTAETLLVLYAMDEAALEEYAKEAGISREDLKEDGTHPVILQNVCRVDDGDRISTQALLTLKGGENFTFTNVSRGDSEKEFSMSLKIAGDTQKAPFGKTAQQGVYQINAYTSEETLDAILAEAGIESDSYTQICLDGEKPLELYEAAEKLRRENPGVITYVYSAAAEKQQVDQIMLLMDVFIYSFIILTSLICVTSIFNTISTGMALRRREYAMLESVGMDRKQFHRMIRYESVFYGVKALGYGLPIGLALTWLIYQIIARSFAPGFYILWAQVGIAVISVLIIVGLTMWYSMRKIEKANIVDALKEENI
jgi:putative ABC transport system permease protein